MKSISIKIFFLLLSTTAISQESILINEIMSSNSEILADNNGEFSDWIELYNPTNATINLENYTLSDDKDEPLKWRFPKIDLAANSYLIVFASEKDKKSGGELHANFKISSSGEALYLHNSLSELIDTYPAIALSDDVSYGRSTDGGSHFERFHTSTPNMTNTLSNGILFSHSSGFYDSTIELTLSSPSGSQIYYTIDGSDPTPESLTYSSPISLAPRNGDADDISLISTSQYWKSPKTPGYKGHVIKAVAYIGEQRSSNVYNHTFFIDAQIKSKYESLKIISIIIDPDHLFNEDEGIYIPGIHFNSSNSVWTGNYFQKGSDWEREGHFRYFDKDGNSLFEQNVGLRIHGGKGRNLPQKSIRVYAKNKYGAKRINYPIFEEFNKKKSFSRITLRNSMSDWNKTIIKDECTSYICKDLDLDVNASQPAVLFLNGEYWGMHSIREYFDENYLEDAYGVDEDDINIVLQGSGNRPDLSWGIDHGSNESHIALYDFLNNNYLEEESNYEHVSNIVDISSIIDYYCAEIYFGNKDWPTNNNKLWNHGGDSKWRQLLYDFDGSWQYNGINFNSLHRVLSPSGSAQSAPYATLLFRKLMESEKFKSLFLTRMACLMKNEFSATNVHLAIAIFKEKYEEGIDEHINRWNYPASNSSWVSSINSMKSYASGRSGKMIQHISSEFGITFNLDDYNCDGIINGIETVSESSPKVVVYPNPSSDGKVRVHFNWKESKFDYSVYDIRGSQLLQGSSFVNEEIQLPTTKGVYILRISSEEKQVVKKIIID